jgi:RNA polymerase sigma-70 factor (ECF subfamily)
MASEQRSAPEPDNPQPVPSESTFVLVARARAGDKLAFEPLFVRYLPRLRRWASGRLPRWARDAIDTRYLVQDTLIPVFKQIDGFEPRREGAFQAYLRQAVMNRIRNAIRSRTRRPDGTSIDDALSSNDQSALERGLERRERYDAALARFRPIDREAIGEGRDGLYVRGDGGHARFAIRGRGVQGRPTVARAPRGGIHA